MDPKYRFFEAIRRNMAYTLSLPERVIRSFAALAGGTTSLLTENLLPDSLRGTTTYNVSIGMLQKFLIEKVAGMERDAAKEGAQVGEDYVRRKIAGTALEAAGLLVMHSSPLWVFAVAGDAAGGSKIFLKRLIEHLKINAVLPKDAEINNLVDLLEAVQEATSKSATVIDTPPLTRNDLTAMADDMMASYGRAFKNTTNLIPRLDKMWENMEALVRRDNITLERLGGIMTVDALNFGKKSANTVLSVGRTGVELFDENILESYRETLSQVAEQGTYQYMAKHLRPFLLSAGAHFDSTNQSWTEKKLSGDSNK